MQKCIIPYGVKMFQTKDINIEDLKLKLVFYAGIPLRRENILVYIVFISKEMIKSLIFLSYSNLKPKC